MNDEPSGTAAQAAKKEGTPAEAVPQDRFDAPDSAVRYAEELAATPPNTVINSPTESEGG